jgi:RNA polymerase sigma-70 factor (ECF subfamily)
MSAIPDQSEALFREHRERLTRFAIRLVGKGADADDLVQDTFLKAHRHLCSGRKISEPLSFLIVTMRNLVNDAHRRRRVVDLRAAPDMDEVVTTDEAPSLERQVMSEREFERLCVAITQLPERMRYAFVLRKVYGYSCREIAEQLGRSTNTVREQVAQGFKRLQALQNEQGEARSGNRRRQPGRQEKDGMRRINITPLPSSE